jgi:hypothetical protein
MCNGNEQIVENQKKTASNFMQRREFPLFIRQKRHKVQPCLGKNEQIPEKKKKKGVHTKNCRASGPSPSETIAYQTSSKAKNRKRKPVATVLKKKHDTESHQFLFLKD